MNVGLLRSNARGCRSRGWCVNVRRLLARILFTLCGRGESVPKGKSRGDPREAKDKIGRLLVVTGAHDVVGLSSRAMCMQMPPGSVAVLSVDCAKDIDACPRPYEILF